MKALITIPIALAAFSGLLVDADQAEAGWKKRGYWSRSYHSRSYYHRPYYGRRYYGRGYYPYRYGYTPGEAAAGILLGLAALAVIQATTQPPAPVITAPGYDVNGNKICVGGPNMC